MVKKSFNSNYNQSGYRTAITGASIFTNYILTAISKVPMVGGIVGDQRIRYNDPLQQFSAQATQERLENYKGSYELPDPKLSQDIAKAFTFYMNSRIHQTGQFSNINASGNESFLTKLAKLTDKTAADAIRNTINKSLEPSSALFNIQNELHALSTFLNDKTQSYDPKTLANYVDHLNIKGIKAMDAQLKQDEASIKQLFENKVFLTQLNTYLGISNIDQFKTELLNTIKKTHHDAVEHYEKNTKDLLKKLKEDAETAALKLDLIASSYENNIANRKKIDQMQTNTPITAGQGPFPGKFKNIKVTEIEALNTIGNLTIKHEEGSNSYTIDIPSRYSPFYQNPNNDLTADLLMLAKLIKANKHEKINIKITPLSGEPEQWRFELARQAYEACRLAGWPENKINIKVFDKEGKEVTIDALFSLHGQVKQRIEEKVNRYMQETKKIENYQSTFKQADFKEQIQRHKSQQATKNTPPGTTNNLTP